MPAQTRAKPQPAGEPRPVPVEDVPDHATPAPGPAPTPEPEQPTGNPLAGFLRNFGDMRADRLPTGDLLDDDPLSAPEALAEVMRRVPAIAKSKTAAREVGGYAFRGIDDVYAALHDLFGEVGLVVLPSTIDREREQRPRSSGSGYNYVTHVHVRLRFLASDGSSEELDGWGEGADTGDKSTGKAYSQAIKSALLAAFLIPTEASAADDPDRTNSEASRAFSPQEVERASRALGAAREATTFDALVNVRRRASELLPVPLTSDGVLAPLEVHLDGLRRALESRVPGEGQS